MNSFDLHMHSMYSGDGQFSPKELIDIADKKGLKIISLTDHDAVKGVKEITELGKEKGIRVIPGIECSTILEGNDVHLLGYGIDIENSYFVNLADRLNKLMYDAFYLRVEKIQNKYGIELDADELIEASHGKNPWFLMWTRIFNDPRYQGIEGTGNDVSDSDVPNTNVETKKKWGFSDLVGSVKSGINMARSAYNTYQTAKSAINTVKNNVDIIKNSIANSGGGLDGILGAIGNTAGALNNIGFAVSTGVGNTLAGIGNTANNMQDTFTDNAGRTENAQQRADGGSSNLVSQWLNSEQGGAGLTNTVSDLNNIISKGASVAGAATTVAHEGQNIGGGGTFGDILGGIMGAGQALVSGADMSQQLQQEKQLEQQRQQQMQQQQQQQQQAASQPLYNSLFDKPSSSTTQKSNSTSTSTSTTSTGNTSTGNTRTNTSTGNTRTNNTPVNNTPANNTQTQVSNIPGDSTAVQFTGFTDTTGQNFQSMIGEPKGPVYFDEEGNRVYTTSNGKVTYNQDGSKYIETNSGKKATINTDGSKVVEDTNTGVQVHLTADGKMWRIDADGKPQELDPNSNLGKQIQKL